MTELTTEENFNAALRAQESIPVGTGDSEEKPFTHEDFLAGSGLTDEMIAQFEAEDNNLDFEAEVKPTRQTVGLPTKDNQAALGASLSGVENIGESFTQLRAQLDDTTTPSSIENIEAVMASDEDEARKGVVERFISDPSKSPAERTEFLQGYLLQRERQSSLISQYMFKTATADSEGETLEADENRLSASELLIQASDAKRAEQRVYNSYQADSNTDVLPFVVDFAEAVVPFSVQANVAQVKSAFEEEVLGKDPSTAWRFVQAIFNPARQKTELIAMIDRTPIADRAKMAESLSQIVTRHSGITGLNKNDFEKQTVLRELTEGGYYGDTEKVLDTFVAVLDLVGLGQAARLLKAPRKMSSFDGPIFDDVFASSPFDEAFTGAPRNAKGDYVKHPTTRGTSLQARTSPSVSPVDAVKGKPQPTSPLATVKDTNPSTARSLYAAGVDDETGKVSEVVSGVPRGDHTYGYPMPNAKTVDDIVDEVPADLYRQGRISDNETKGIVSFSYKPSGISYPKFEQDAAAVRIYTDLAEVTGLSPRLEMSKYDNSRGFVNTTMVYGASPDTGFSTIREALDTVEFNLRPFGVTVDDLQILVQDPITHKYLPSPASGKNVSAQPGSPQPIPTSEYDSPGNFLIELNYKRGYNPADTDMFGTQAIVWKGIDRFTGHLFSADRYLADASTRFQRYIAQGAFRAVDKGFAIQTKLQDLLEARLGKLLPESQSKVLELAKESNRDRYKYSNEEALLKGLTQTEADGLRDWYRFWDTVWELDNRDLVRTLRNDGFQLFKNDTTGTELFVQPVSRGEARGVKNIYDPHTDEVFDDLSEEFIAEIYAGGGTIARSRRPITLNSSVDAEKGVVQVPVSYVVSRQDSSNVLRGLRDDDTALAYIPGYYKVDYGKNKYFVDRITKDAKDKEIVTTIAASDSSGHAKYARDRLDKSTPDGVSHTVRRARESKVITEQDDAEWDLNVARGRSSQRFRGQRLSSIEGGDLVAGDALLRDPVETAHQVASSLSKRVAMRDWIESMKQRWVNTYADRFSNGIFPDNGNRIKGEGRVEEDVTIADAKGLHEYIRFMEQIENSMVDDGFKLMNMGIAELLEGASDSVVRGMIAKPFRAAQEIGPLQQMRKAAFVAYIAANPVRQFVVQSWQWSQLLGLDPEFVGKSLHRQSAAILMSKATGTNDGLAKVFGLQNKKELDEVIAMWEESGLHQAVDSNILIEGSQRQTLTDRASTQAGRNAQAVSRSPGAVLNITKKVGFDAGEYYNLLAGWLFARNKFIKEGADLTNPETSEFIAVAAREYTYGMNKAGQYKHSEGVVGALTQFMTVPQKAVFSMVPGGSKGYTPVERRQLAAFNLVAYGPPANLFSSMVAGIFLMTGEQNIEPGLVQDIEHGLMDTSINWAIESYTGRRSTLDIEGSFAPGAITPFYDLAQGLLEDPKTAFASGSLLLGENSRVMQIYNQTRFAWENEGLTSAEATLESLQIASGFFSGMSNLWKVMAMQDYQRKFSGASGRDLPTGTTGTPAEVAVMLGIQDRTTSEMFEAFKTIKKRREAVTKDVEDYYKAAKAHVIRRGVDKDAELFLKSMRAFWDTYKTDPETARFAREEFARVSAEDAKTNTQNSLIQAILKASNVTGREEYINLVNSSGLKDETKRLLIEAVSERYR